MMHIVTGYGRRLKPPAQDPHQQGGERGCGTEACLMRRLKTHHAYHPGSESGRFCVSTAILSRALCRSSITLAVSAPTRGVLSPAWPEDPEEVKVNTFRSQFWGCQVSKPGHDQFLTHLPWLSIEMPLDPWESNREAHSTLLRHLPPSSAGGRGPLCIDTWSTMAF
jgi:hypothetical protein